MFFIFLISFLRITILTSNRLTFIYQYITLLSITLSNFFVLVTFLTTYNIFENLISFKIHYPLENFLTPELTFNTSSTLLHSNFLDLHIVSVYYFPYIYIFILVTFLAIFFCLSYNKEELSLFMVFCFIILFSGYTLFYTDSLILFFMAYEMLLIPSFFILYKFAKTRRSVEAAYLMFF